MTFKSFLIEKGTKPTRSKHYNNHDEWEADAKKLGYRVKKHNEHSAAVKTEKGDHPGTPYYGRSRGHFWHKGGFGILRYKYMPEAFGNVVNTAQDKAQRGFGKQLEKKIIKPQLPKPGFKDRLVKPVQSNIKNQIDALASNPMGIPSGQPTR